MDSLRRCVRALGATDPRHDRMSLVLTLLAVAGWVTCVLYTTSYHEYWRDEVRPLSFAREAGSFLGLWEIVGRDGHPALWPVILYLLDGILPTNQVLGLASLSIAFLAIVLFLWKAPLPLWVKCLAVFSSVPLYEYSVMARNYGISMLLMFSVAWLYRTRHEHPLLLATALALLANTNAHSAGLAFVFAGIWALHEAQDRWHGRTVALPPHLAIAVGIFLCGVGLAAYTVYWPSADDYVISKVSERVSNESPFDLVAVLRFPADQFFDIIRPRHRAWQTAILLMLCAGLLGELATFAGAVVAILGLSLFFDIVSTGWYRHQALLIPFILSAYWIATDRMTALGAADRARWRGQLLQFGQVAALPLLLVPLLKDSFDFIVEDVTMAWSSGEAFGQFLTDHPEYADAILIGEPGYLLESLPYYVDARIYFPRERRFGTTARFWEQDRLLTLGALLDTAERAAQCEGKPVLIVFGHSEIDDTQALQKTFSYGSEITWTADERQRMRDRSVRVASFRDSLEETYDVFEVAATHNEDHRKSPANTRAKRHDCTEFSGRHAGQR